MDSIVSEIFEIMRKKILITFFALIAAITMQAQKYALIDMEYILKNIPAYERANEQLNQQSRRWQSEIEVLAQEAQALYKKYQNESMFLSDEQRKMREEEILTAEKKAGELKRLYFGPDGELYKKRESLISPIQDEIYNAVKDICDRKGYSMVIDRASAMSIIYASPKIDISNEVLSKLGYSN